MSKCPECGGIHETPTLPHKTDWECLRNQLANKDAEVERLQKAESNLATLLRRTIRFIKTKDPENNLVTQAEGYLSRCVSPPSILREEVNTLADWASKTPNSFEACYAIDQSIIGFMGQLAQRIEALERKVNKT